MKILAAIAILLPLSGCIVIPVAALLGAKLAHTAYKQAKECELAAERCRGN
jgi:hypothetical protein